MATKNIRSLSGREGLLLAALSSTGRNVFTIEDARRILRAKGPGAKKFVHRLVEKGWIRGIERGKYLIIPFEAGPERVWTEEAHVVASYLVRPYAIAYWSAMAHYNYTEQIPTTVFVASTKRRIPSEAEILRVPFKFITLSPHKFFGLAPRTVGDREVTFTDREKTLVDCLDHPEYCGGISEAAKALSIALREGNISLDKLTRYADRMKNRTIFKRLGYLCEILRLPVDGYVHAWYKKVSKGYSDLDPTQPDSGPYNYRWLLRANVPENALLGGF